MIKALFSPAAIFVILVFAVATSAGVLQAQEVPQTPTATDPASNGDELSDEEIIDILVKESNEHFTQWRKKRGFRVSKECSDYNGVKRPTRPEGVYCEAAEIPAERIELYRENQRHQRSTFVNEPQIKF
ncbi:MAG: hypothetical protein ACI8S3_002029 [Alphaproteobacteria bacterium]|jgi:hypothetical protein